MDRFWIKVLKTETCWEWQASRSKDGYGHFGFRGAVWKAHRVAYTLCVGEIPAGQEIMHSCDNPGCVNPAHLQPGTHAENMRQMSERRRRHGKGTGKANGRHQPHDTWKPLFGNTNGMTKLPDERLSEVFTLRAQGLYQRQIGERLGISQTQVGNILRGISRKQVIS